MNDYHCSNDGCRYVPLWISKIDSVSETGVPGAVFELTTCNGCTRRGTTDVNGLILFGVARCTSYTLREVSAPAGYVAGAHVYNICVASRGCIFVDGILTSQVIIRNTPISASFTAIKMNMENGMPLAGAVYSLLMDSSEIASTISNAMGQVTFTNLSPGAYELVETTPPPGFQANAESLPVVADQDGSVTINGQPAHGFILNDVPVQDIPVEVSAPPTIDTIVEGASLITGTGVPGSAIVVTLPNGATVTTIVAASGTWMANVPSGVVLAAGDMVSANQTETGKTVSGDAYGIVIGDTAVEPGIDIYVENLTTGQNYAQAGNVLLYDVIISNHGTAASVWQSAYATFSLGSYVTLQENSIRINNRTATSSEYSYDSTANTLTVYLGNIVGGSSVSVSYRVTVNLDISDINEIIMDAIFGSLA